ncbi:GntR family transcriptional regulator [Salinibacterium sp. M195]|uniref:GntR family transcriptional regulator n=1 Tax=Salinibacterium sp. M195 TaxID=2583374 RepID=UPI001C6326D7|nr:GntR family transcriptional regulator [Salinibacterium sp. M195]QYH36008.1 GntR family transcriptional regulator [Salinibacterium sp. M195]
MVTKKSRPGLSEEIVATLRMRIDDATYPPASRLPTEAQLCEEFSVSRATVRSAIKELDVVGLVYTRHGLGTYVRSIPYVQDGLERMGSISESIRLSGKTPGMEYARRVVREVNAAEAARMSVPLETLVLELRRRITADGQVVVYSYDLLPMSIFKPDFDPRELEGSVFAYFENELGTPAALGYAEVHAVESRQVAWGPDSAEHTLFILLDQLQYAEDGLLLGYSRSYFVEGSYAFKLKRTK